MRPHWLPLAPLRNVGLALLPAAVSAVTSAGVAIVLLRGLGAEAFGKLALIASFQLLAAGLSDPGIGQTAVRYSARAYAGGDQAGALAVLRWSLVARLRIAAVVGGGLALVAPLIAGAAWGQWRLVPLIWLVLCGSLGAPLVGLPVAHFQARQQFGPAAALLSLQPCALTGGVLLLAWRGAWAVELVVLVQVAAALAAAGVAWLVTWGVLPRAWRARPAQGVPDPGHFAGLHSASTLLTQLAARVDLWLVGALLGSTAAGIYGVASRLMLPLGSLLSGVTTVLWAQAGLQRHPSERAALLRQAAGVTFPAALLCLGYALLLPWLVATLLGATYGPAVGPGVLLCLHYAVQLLGYPVVLAGYNAGLVGRYWRINLLQLLLIGALNLLLLPHWGLAAPGVSLLASYGVGLLLVLWLLRAS